MADSNHEEQLQFSIAKALLYSDIFSYPLTAEEIFRRLTTNHTCVEEVKKMLSAMKDDGIVFQFGNFFSIRNEQTLERRRTTGNQKASVVLPAALRRGRFLGKFPFIRAVMISGSLSKNYMENGSDVDYFVITRPGRLWLARFFFALFKRVFLFNSHKHFCVNYYLSEDNLEIEEKNIFTATELTSLIPVCGNQFVQLMMSNSWVRDYFPNMENGSGKVVLDAPFPIWKKLIESVINPLGDRLDHWIMNYAIQRYRRRYAHAFSQKDFDIAFKSKRGVSKSHNLNYQKRVTELYNSKVEGFVQDRRIAVP